VIFTGPRLPVGGSGQVRGAGLERWCGPAALSRLTAVGGPLLPQPTVTHRARMCQEPELAWLERQAEVMEDLVAERQAAHR
jgi:hypothetical protein